MVSRGDSCHGPRCQSRPPWRPPLRPSPAGCWRHLRCSIGREKNACLMGKKKQIFMGKSHGKKKHIFRISWEKPRSTGKPADFGKSMGSGQDFPLNQREHFTSRRYIPYIYIHRHVHRHVPYIPNIYSQHRFWSIGCPKLKTSWSPTSLPHQGWPIAGRDGRACYAAHLSKGRAELKDISGLLVTRIQ